jgi:branched-chain amino acid transport system substrate-binding protein
MIEGLSGPFANAGESVQRNLQFAIDRVNGRGGVSIGGVRRPFELLPMDSKGQADEALGLLRLAADRKAPFVLQGNSSAIAAAISEAVSRHNERAPDLRMLFLNYSAVDPALTNERCSFWHFRFDAHADMRMAALADAIAGNRSVRRVYLINQDYSFGRHVARSAREAIGRRRPDVQVVADELHPLGRIRDFAPYALKVAASGADTVVTGNWGNDLALLVRACRDAGLDLDWYTFYGNSLGAPSTIGEAGVGRIRAVAEWHPNAGVAAAESIHADFRARLRDPRDDYFNMRHVVMVEMLAAAIEAAGTTEAAAVARALEGRTHRGAPYEATMRREDHQLLTPLYVTVMQRAGTDPAVRLDVEGSGYGFRTERFVAAADATLPPSGCRMDRPAA